MLQAVDEIKADDDSTPLLEAVEVLTDDELKSVAGGPGMAATSGA